MIEKIYSILNPQLLLHIINRQTNLEEKGERVDICNPLEPLQVAVLNLNTGRSFAAHYHLWKNGEDFPMTQETWIVVYGNIKVHYYDEDGKTLIKTAILNGGDCTVTLLGGHSYEVVQGPALVYEVKNGPYLGKETDKVML